MMTQVHYLIVLTVSDAAINKFFININKLSSARSHLQIAWHSLIIYALCIFWDFQASKENRKHKLI